MNINYQKFLFTVAAAVLLAGVSVRASETDERIESAARSSYVFKTYLKDDSIKISSRDGVVTLAGNVKEESHKSLAKEVVASLPGVNSVDNQLVFEGQPATENSDTWLSIKVKSALLFHRHVSAARTQVYVNDGLVTLKGEADSQAEKDLAGEYAKDIEGVKGVNNTMTIAANPPPRETMKEKIDDASITAQVKMALLSHHSTSAINTHVETRDGVVTVSGKANNSAEKELVTKLVEDIDGVNSVINNMSM